MKLAKETTHVLARLGLVAVAIAGCTEASSSDTRVSAPRTVDDVDDGPSGPEEFPTPVPAEHSSGAVQEMTVETPWGPLAFKYRMINGEAIAEGDTILPEPSGPEELRSATSIGRHWPNGVVPYVISANLPAPERVTAAIAHWEAKTKLRFVGRTMERDYVHFRPGGGCSSSVGQVGGRQFVNLTTSEAAGTVVAIGIDRTATPERVYYFYSRGFATAGTTRNTTSASSHFRYLPASGKAITSIVDVAFGSNGHLYAFYDDGSVSEGSREDFALYAPARPYALARGKTPSDVVGFAIDATDQAHAFYKDGTFSIGSVFDLDATATRKPFTVATGKTPADVAFVDVATDGAFHAFYRDETALPDGGVSIGRVLQSSSGPATTLGATSGLAKTTFSGHCPTGATIHEIGHAVGLFHEQTRFDRNDYVTIMWDNIIPENRFNFEKHSRIVGTDTGAYDLGSIMHYGPTAFSANGAPTIVPVAGGTFTEQREGLSPLDIAGVAAMYR